MMATATCRSDSMPPVTDIRSRFRHVAARLAGAVVALAMLGHGPAAGADAPAGAGAGDEGRKAFRVCRDPNNLPFQNARGEGFEDRIAALFAAELGVPVEAYDYPARFNFIRNTLRFKLPGDDFPCDIVMDVPAGFSQGTATTRPYYRSTYALVIPAASPLAGTASVEAFLALPQEKLAALRIGVIDKSPASNWLAKRGLIDLGKPYQLLSADPDKSSQQSVEDDLIAGRLDAAILWGPIAGHFARSHPDAKLAVLPLQSERNIKFDYEIAMAVRIADKAWLKTIDGLIARNQAKIDAILRDYGVPLLEPLPPAGGGRDD